MSAALLPCPFCGEKESLYVRHVEGTILHPAYFVACDNCGAQGATTDKGDQVEKWNARTIAPPVAAGSVDLQRYHHWSGHMLPDSASGAYVDYDSAVVWGEEQREAGRQEGKASNETLLRASVSEMDAMERERDEARQRAEKAEAELAELKRLLRKEMAHAEVNDLRLLPAMGQQNGRYAVPSDYLEACIEGTAGGIKCDPIDPSDTPC